jgi:hypothetical protein
MMRTPLYTQALVAVAQTAVTNLHLGLEQQLVAVVRWVFIPADVAGW